VGDNGARLQARTRTSGTEVAGSVLAFPVLTVLAVLAVIIGLAALIKGAVWLVVGASSLALRLGMTPLAVGLTVVAFGTSAPELLVSLVAVLAGRVDVAVGNVLGSNTSNILLILGSAALVRALPATRGALRCDLPVGLLLTAAVIGFGWDGRLVRLEALLLWAVFAGFMVSVLRRKERDASEVPSRVLSLPRSVLWVLAGIVVLVLGAELLVRGAVHLAQAMGASEALIGLTLVAVGTSLPEMATSVVAAQRGETDIAVGNVLGSNVFNVGWVLGFAYLVAPGPVNPLLARFDAPVSALATLALGVGLGWRGRLGRREGVLFLLMYAAYVGFLVWRG